MSKTLNPTNRNRDKLKLGNSKLRRRIESKSEVKFKAAFDWKRGCQRRQWLLTCNQERERERRKWRMKNKSVRVGDSKVQKSPFWVLVVLFVVCFQTSSLFLSSLFTNLDYLDTTHNQLRLFIFSPHSFLVLQTYTLLFFLFLSNIRIQIPCSQQIHSISFL